MTRFNMVGFILTISLAGCSKDSTDNSSTRIDFPERVTGASDATAGERFGLLGSDSLENIVVDLAKLPENASPNLWACYQIPDDNFVLGEAVCASDISLKLPITAANVTFSCSLNPDFVNRITNSMLAISGCSNLEVFLYKFRPALQVELK